MSNDISAAFSALLESRQAAIFRQSAQAAVLEAESLALAEAHINAVTPGAWVFEAASGELDWDDVSGPALLLVEYSHGSISFEFVSRLVEKDRSNGTVLAWCPLPRRGD